MRRRRTCLRTRTDDPTDQSTPGRRDHLIDPRPRLGWAVEIRVDHDLATAVSRLQDSIGGKIAISAGISPFGRAAEAHDLDKTPATHVVLSSSAAATGCARSRCCLGHLSGWPVPRSRSLGGSFVSFRTTQTPALASPLRRPEPRAIPRRSGACEEPVRWTAESMQPGRTWGSSGAGPVLPARYDPSVSPDLDLVPLAVSHHRDFVLHAVILAFDLSFRDLVASFRSDDGRLP